MTDKIDYEKLRKLDRALKRGREFVDGKKLTDRQVDRLREGIEKSNKKAARIVDAIRLKEKSLSANNPRQQIAYLEYLFRLLSPSHKRSKRYGLFLKRKISELKETAGLRGEENGCA